jgi:hypothetical protein
VTPRPPLPPTEPFSAEERELAARLAKLDAAAGPSAALDARILGAARAAAAPVRPARRWPGAVGAAAVLVAAVGLAWQLRPMFQLPPPSIGHAEHAGDAGTAGANSETVVQIESVPRAPMPVAAVGDQQAAPAAPTARRSASSKAGGTPAPRTAANPPRAARTRSPEFVDEAMPAADAASPAAAAAPPPPPPPAQDSMRMSPEPQLKTAATATAGRAASPIANVEADTRLSTRAWLARIRERRDAGDLAGAHASLVRFIVAHPRRRVPDDLRPLLRDDDPWAP